MIQPGDAPLVPAALVEERRAFRSVFPGVMLAMLLASLDQTILAAAIPAIVGALGGLENASWLSAAYLLADAPLPAAPSGAFEAHLARLVDARASNLEVAQKASRALVTALGGGAMARSNPAQRLAREALFYVVQAQTVAIRRASLERLTTDLHQDASSTTSDRARARGSDGASDA